MNKAFVREPDQHVDYCPRCGSQGQPLGREVEAHLPGQDGRGRRSCQLLPIAVVLGTWCTSMLSSVLLTGDLSGPIYPKDPDAPICACFGLDPKDIEQDVREGVWTE